MKAFLRIADSRYPELIAHLLPPGSQQEQGIFLHVRPRQSNDQLIFDAVEMKKLIAADFLRQEGDYLELADDTRAGLIKRAHDLGTSLVEIHSHLGDFPAAFSWSDRIGLKETVPHMRWRLKNKPYLALVVTESNFDALVWLDDPQRPHALSGLLVGEQVLTPTNLSLTGW